MTLDPAPWTSPYHDNRSAYPEFDEAVFSPRDGYSQVREDYLDSRT